MPDVRQWILEYFLIHSVGYPTDIPADGIRVLSPDITLKMLMAAIRKGKLPRDFPIVGSFFKNNSPLILLEDSKREKENENIKCQHGYTLEFQR